MEVITKRAVIRGVRARHASMYERDPDDRVIGFGDKRRPLGETRAALAALDLETATEAEVVAILNESWTSLKCDQCGEDQDAVVRMGDFDGYESRWLDVCERCLTKARTLFTHA